MRSTHPAVASRVAAARAAPRLEEPLPTRRHTRRIRHIVPQDANTHTSLAADTETLPLMEVVQTGLISTTRDDNDNEEDYDDDVDDDNDEWYKI